MIRANKQILRWKFSFQSCKPLSGSSGIRCNLYGGAHEQSFFSKDLWSKQGKFSKLFSFLWLQLQPITAQFAPLPCLFCCSVAIITCSSKYTDRKSAHNSIFSNINGRTRHLAGNVVKNCLPLKVLKNVSHHAKSLQNSAFSFVLCFACLKGLTLRCAGEGSGLPKLESLVYDILWVPESDARSVRPPLTT